MFWEGLRGSGAGRNSATPWMFSLWMRRARCHLQMCWRVRLREVTSCSWVTSQQLEQPQKGSHPENSDISALAHLLDGRRTISEGKGLFLAETWRLHPAICRFTSELFYEGRLFSHKGLEQQNIQAPEPFSGSDLWFVPVIHEGNQSYSAEEVEEVSTIIKFLTRAGSTWTD